MLVGEDPASQNYVRMKHKDCEELGIASIMKELPGDCTQEELEALIDDLNTDDSVTGYIVQLPLPKHLDENRILELIDPAKDADGLHPVNLGKLVLNEPAPLPCTPNGCLHLLRRFGVELDGAKTVVIGRGVTVGRPLGLLLTRRSENATVTLCHTATRHLPQLTLEADIVIAAAGVLVVNDPHTLANALSKAYFQHFPKTVRPRTLISTARRPSAAAMLARRLTAQPPKVECDYCRRRPRPADCRRPQHHTASTRCRGRRRASDCRPFPKTAVARPAR